jgi:hypothetical protein
VSVFDYVGRTCSNWRAQDSRGREQKATSQTSPVTDHVGSKDTNEVVTKAKDERGGLELLL